MVSFVAERIPDLWRLTCEHIYLTGVATGLAIVVGVPVGILAARRKALRGPLLGLVGILQTVPSLAMLAILLTLLGKIGAWPAVIALFLYALLPVVRNTLAGLEGVPPGTIEAARGIGMTGRQELLQVQLPLATPVIVAGIRTAAVVGVGIATLSAFIGAGGLGEFINRGLAMRNNSLILLGAVPAGILALLVDFSLGAAEWGLRPMRLTQRRSLLGRLRPVAVALPILVAAPGMISHVAAMSAQVTSEGQRAVRVASKNFTEQLILGELMAQLIETRGGMAVERKFNLGGTMICHGAMEQGEVDLYAEYTGTGLTAVLKLPVVTDPNRALKTVSREYREKFGLLWLKPFGFNNTYAITIREEMADKLKWSRISDLAAEAGRMRAGFTAEFAEREDGYPGLKKKYGFSFGEVRDLDPAIMYEAIARKEVDVICAFATDGRIAAYGLAPLEDDMRFFPPYYAAPVVREEALAEFPKLRMALAPLAGLLDDAAMQKLNLAVDKKKEPPADVARAFLKEKGLI